MFIPFFNQTSTKINFFLIFITATINKAKQKDNKNTHFTTGAMPTKKLQKFTTKKHKK